MSDEKILLLNYDARGKLGTEFHAALESCAREGIDIEHAPAQFEEDEACEDGLSVGSELASAPPAPTSRLSARASSPASSSASSTSSPTPSLVLLILSQSQLGRAASLIESWRRETPGVPIAVVTEAAEPEEMLELFEAGMNDFFTLPFKPGEVFSRVSWLLQHARRNASLTHVLKEKLGLRQLVGESAAFQQEVKKIPLIANCDAGVLITGETGTGKELCARAIHYLSPRASRPFVPVNCGAIALELAENELFGHERGAFTGAFASQVGLVQMADAGTLFLDEIDCLAPGAQVKLLRFLQEKEYRPLGSAKVCKADVRVIAATNADLKEAVKSGKLRQDLFYRLNIIPLRLPPLRERREDIPRLAQHFLSKHAAKSNRPGLRFSPDALLALARHDWPGNVRELENVVEREVALTRGEVITLVNLDLPCGESPGDHTTFQAAKAQIISQFERNYLDELLQAYHGNVTKAAEVAHKNRRALSQLIRKHGINVKRFRLSTSSE
ncbi:MAG TPA: sigma-54 dependent transcriptional regulator [Pyrinomonadaceae bacterium]|jgi:DNA-binding NtrC family response regulator|nr:sigma-54 dependent transcriptional regulator [Pyrinomonadaceae bacterium]